MYKYDWDAETGGVILLPEQEKMSKEARPVYYRELDLLGFDKYWSYPKDDSAPIMWAEANKYFYRGNLFARTIGGAVYTAPKLEIVADTMVGTTLQSVDVEKMVDKNRNILQALTQETIESAYDIYLKYKNKVDLYYVAFSGGKDSIVTLDIVNKFLPSNEFVVIFSDTLMEAPDTYNVVNYIEKKCRDLNVKFFKSKANFFPSQSWRVFGPPSTIHRWCCSVHKTAPQICLLRKITGKTKFTGMAFMGVRGEESARRSKYDYVSQKHQGQYCCHVILDWNSIEVFLYSYLNKLPLNETYKKGNPRAGCLVCPNSSGRYEYIKRECYKEQSDQLYNIIAETSSKGFNHEEMKKYIDAGYWRLRKTGRELNISNKDIESNKTENQIIFTIPKGEIDWLTWGKTIGTIVKNNNDTYSISYHNKFYIVKETKKNNNIVIATMNCENTYWDLKFQSLLRSVMIKSLYCVSCGMCEAECKVHAIDMSNGVNINDKCVHCGRCHNVRDRCLHYGSIKDGISEGKIMTGLNRYRTFGVQKEWIDTFFKYRGEKGFWQSSADGMLPTPKMEALVTFLRDANIVEFRKNIQGDKFSKNIPTELGLKLFSLGSGSEACWAIIAVNVSYSPLFNWIITEWEENHDYTPDEIKLKLESIMVNDQKGLSKRNIVSSLKNLFVKTPLGDGLLGTYSANIKKRSDGFETVTLKSLRRTNWINPIPEVILYSLYKFAEACGDLKQFSLSTLMDDSIERDGISPTRIFGIGHDGMKKILNGLSANYPDYISATFSLDLEEITLMPNKTSLDVLDLL